MKWRKIVWNVIDYIESLGIILLLFYTVIEWKIDNQLFLFMWSESSVVVVVVDTVVFVDNTYYLHIVVAY